MRVTPVVNVETQTVLEIGVRGQARPAMTVDGVLSGKLAMGQHGAGVAPRGIAEMAFVAPAMCVTRRLMFANPPSMWVAGLTARAFRQAQRIRRTSASDASRLALAPHGRSPWARHAMMACSARLVRRAGRTAVAPPLARVRAVTGSIARWIVVTRQRTAATVSLPAGIAS